MAAVREAKGQECTAFVSLGPKHPPSTSWKNGTISVLLPILKTQCRGLAASRCMLLGWSRVGAVADLRPLTFAMTPVPLDLNQAGTARRVLPQSLTVLAMGSCRLAAARGCSPGVWERWGPRFVP